jgi:hypothetical protein
MLMMMPLSARLLLLIFAGASGAFGAFGGGALPVAAAGLESPPAQSVPPAALLASVRADAARRAGVAEGEVRVVRSEGREWPDGGLGCPRPGEFYIQVITPGYLLVLQAGGRQFEYHTDAERSFTLCREGAGAGLPATGSTLSGITRWLPLWGVLALGALVVTVARRRSARSAG